MAASRKVEEFDLEALKKLKMSLFCAICKKPPRPGKELYTCHTCEDIRCNIHRNQCKHGKNSGKATKIDPHLAKFVESIKHYNCLYFKNGCLMEFEVKDLEAHEKTCFLRDVDCPMILCNDKIPFNGIVDHYQEKHPNLTMIGNVLEFKGSLEDLKKKCFILKCHGRLFYPQFHVRTSSNVLRIWVLGYGDQTEINSFEVTVKFWINGRTTFAHDFVMPIDSPKIANLIGEECLTFPIKRIAQYYDVQSNEFKDQEYVEFEMKVTSPKLDEIAKDEHIESGVEDSDTEEKYDAKKPKIRKTAGKRKAN